MSAQETFLPKSARHDAVEAGQHRRDAKLAQARDNLAAPTWRRAFASSLRR
jgi:hypothetical protein